MKLAPLEGRKAKVEKKAGEMAVLCPARITAAGNARRLFFKRNTGIQALLQLLNRKRVGAGFDPLGAYEWCRKCQ